MSLIDDLKSVKGGYNGVNVYVVEDEVENVETVSNQFRGSGRWTERWTAVFKRDEELVGMDYEVPSTEMQEGGDFFHEVYPVESYTETVTKYRKKA